ncbi:M1-specific T cell receptor beta chain-like isoform X2 [Pempheris klunzingeri]|uniref:M1-specific T cell receptor beta chain-like isoform X2 n=1 Tax=Pempheris klunzingeri TaxID=3127111 RepID=UPI00397F85E2
MIIFFCITFNVILVSGSSLSNQVKQDPAEMYSKPGVTAKITCSHSIEGYTQIFWYKQLKNKEMQFLGYMNVKDGYPEEGVNVTIEGRASKGETCTLTTEQLSLDSSAVYFCAAKHCDSSGNEAYFGGGTKLTVLEPEHPITEPTVKVLPPSQKECRNQKDNEKRKTLVCVASEFYPDHVSVSWQIGEKEVTDGVATDSAALRNGKYYSITSRLRVSAEVWYEPSNKFICTVSFFINETTKKNSSAFIHGEKAKDTNAMTREKYLRITQSAKLTYSVFIVKSSIYGAFVAFLVWKLQGSSGKQNY